MPRGDPPAARPPFLQVTTFHKVCALVASLVTIPLAKHGQDVNLMVVGLTLMLTGSVLFSVVPTQLPLVIIGSALLEQGSTFFLAISVALLSKLLVCVCVCFVDLQVGSDRPPEENFRWGTNLMWTNFLPPNECFLQFSGCCVLRVQNPSGNVSNHPLPGGGGVYNSAFLWGYAKLEFLHFKFCTKILHAICSVFLRICAGDNSKRPLFLMGNYWEPHTICSLIFQKWHRFCRARICRFPRTEYPPPR